MDKFSPRRMPLLLALVALATAALVLTGGASASKPTFYSSPTITYKDGNPVTAPKVGDVLQGNNGGIWCDPSCNPLDPTAIFPNGPNQELKPGDDPPVGMFFQFRRCNGSGCFIAQAKSTNRYYTVTNDDAGYGIRLTVILTNLDCTYPRSYDLYQECRYSSASEDSSTTPVVTGGTPVVVPPAVVVSVSPGELPAGAVGQSYAAQTVTASGGAAPYTFSVSSGSLPPGLALGTDGKVTGTPTAAGTFQFTVQAKDANGKTGTRTYTVKVNLSVSPAELPEAVVGQPYKAELAVNGGTAPFTWKVSSGALPDGLSLRADGTIRGTPLKGDPDTWTFTVMATDSKNLTANATYDLKIKLLPLAFDTESTLPAARIGSTYRQRLTATGGVPEYTFALVGGKLPRGIVLKEGGLLMGVAHGKPGVYRFRVSVTDSTGARVTAPYTLRVLARGSK